MGLVFSFLVNSLFFLLCSGVRYFFSNLVSVFIIFKMKFLSLLFVAVSFCFVSTDLDSRGRDDKAGTPELGTSEHGTGEILESKVSGEAATGVEAMIETSSSEVQTVQLDIERWYLLFM